MASWRNHHPERSDSPERRVFDRRAKELTLCIKPRTPKVPPDADASRNRVAVECAFLLDHAAELHRSKRAAAGIAPSLQADRFEPTPFVIAKSTVSAPGNVAAT